MKKLKLIKQDPNRDFQIKTIFREDLGDDAVLTVGVVPTKESPKHYVVFFPLEKQELLDFTTKEIFFILFQNSPLLDVTEINDETDKQRILSSNEPEYSAVLKYVFDYLAEQAGGYKALLSEFMLADCLSHYVFSALRIERIEKMLFQEIAVGSELKEHSETLLHIYNSFSIPSFDKDTQEQINFIFWSIINALSSCNSLAIASNDQSNLSAFALAKKPFTLERLYEAIDCGMDYFNIKKYAYEIKTLMDLNLISSIEKSQIHKNVFIHHSHGNYTLSLIDFGKIKTIISVLYRNHLGKKEDTLMKAINLEISEKILELCPRNGHKAAKSIQLFDGLFTLNVVTQSDSLNLGVKLVSAEEVLTKITPKPKLS